ncbi:MAG: RNHCP domain-containing protein [Ruminococcus sp.]|jgi:DNA-directed RNA polymerase subunit RPC12/RpoP|nr:RNHCP domain-containing protein [Ruminococcus sp.]
MESKRFTMINESFVCAVCGQKTEKLKKTARDHCPRCLCSIHLDINPGDRAADCGGILRPVGIINGKKGLQIEYKCEKCGAVKRNITAPDDDYDLICRISAGN